MSSSTRIRTQLRFQLLYLQDWQRYSAVPKRGLIALKIKLGEEAIPCSPIDPTSNESYESRFLESRNCAGWRCLAKPAPVCADMRCFRNGSIRLVISLLIAIAISGVIS